MGRKGILTEIIGMVLIRSLQGGEQILSDEAAERSEEEKIIPFERSASSVDPCSSTLPFPSPVKRKGVIAWLG